MSQKDYYQNATTCKVYATKDDCYEEMTSMQDDGVTLLLNAMKKYIADTRKTDRKLEAVLSTGLQYITDCIDYTQEKENGKDEELIKRIFDSHIDIVGLDDYLDYCDAFGEEDYEDDYDDYDD